MKLLFDQEKLDQILESEEWVLLYFSGENCNVCKTFKPKIREMVERKYPAIHLYDVPTEQSPELVSRFRMFNIPGIMLFVEGREYIREVRNISVFELDAKIGKLMELYNL